MPLLQSYHAPARLIADQLRRAPPFATLPTDPQGCLALLREGSVFEVPANVEIVAPGDPAALLVVTEGGLCEQGGARVWSAGSCLGVSEILAGTPFAAAIRTVAPTLLYRLQGVRLETFHTLCPTIASRLLHDMARSMAAPIAG